MILGVGSTCNEIEERIHHIREAQQERELLKTENAKLRELAKKLKACNSSCGRCIELYGKCEHETEMRELGIEVSK